jgi:hypothetical protein
MGEFRTMFDRESDFRIHGSYFNESWRTNEQDDVVDRTIVEQNIARNRWSLIGTHRYALPSDWLTFSDFAVYRDDLFTRELVDKFDISDFQAADTRRSRFSESRFGAFRGWNDTFFKGEWNFYQDFIQPDDLTPFRTPQLASWGRRFLSGFPLEFRWRGEGVNYVRREGGDGLRLDLRPELVVPFHFASRRFFGSLSAAPRETVYHLYTPVKSSDRNLSRELFELRGQLATSLSRVFNFNALGLSRVKHVIEPELSYLFVPSTDQSHIPIMDEVDRINRRNVLTFALNNRLWGKTSGGFAAPSGDSDVELLTPGLIGDVRRMALFRLAMSYDIDKERKGGDSLSDIDLNLRFSPLPYLDVGLDGGLDPGAWKISQARLAFGITDPRPLRPTPDPDFNRPNSLGLSYHYLRRGPNSFLADDANIDLDAPADCFGHPLDPRCPGTGFDRNTVGNIGASMLYHLHDNLLVHFSSTYDARDSRFIGFRVITKFLSFCECWTATFSVKQDVNPDKTSFGFEFTLLGLGTTRSALR